MTVTRSDDITVPTQPTFPAWRSNVEAHEARLIELIGPASVDEFVRATHILEAFWQDGTLGYGILAATKAHAQSPNERTRIADGK
jgi:27-O-demethylrifamycin SV methyltransferase